MASKKTIFGSMTFNNGWKSSTSISLYGKNYTVTVKAAAWKEADDINPAQLNAFREFYNGRKEQLEQVEKALAKHGAKRFTPKELVFERDGSYALLLDDSEDLDNGFAVVIKPLIKVMSQDDYL